jgi:hypothetical protein
MSRQPGRDDNRGMMRFVLGLAFAVGWVSDARAQDYHGKATMAVYEAGGNPSLDLNVRYSSGDFTSWAGYYGTSENDHQGRAGVEYDLKRSNLFLVPSVQIASHGFVGGSVYSEIGPTVYLIAGASRTNLHPYANLTFDPNESWQLGAGWHMGDDSLAGYTIWDNRLGTGQQITHLILKHYMPRKRRITLDISYKSGHGDDGVYVHGLAEQVEYDRRRWFAKGAVDAHANYGPDTMVRIGGGFRF